MQRIGERLKARARALDLTDSEIARRLGLSQGRYSNYVNEIVEPDLGTLVRITRTLGLTADEVLGMAQPAAEDETQVLRTRIALAAETMDLTSLQAAAAMVSVRPEPPGNAPLADIPARLGVVAC